MTDVQEVASSDSPQHPVPPQEPSATEGAPLVADVAPAHVGDADLRTKLLELEYQYLTQSSFQTDTLRNQFVQFYLVIVGVAATALVGLAQVQAKDGQMQAGLTLGSSWIYSLIALFIGALGVIMLQLFARLRRVVIECLQGMVLLKRYALDHLGVAPDSPLDSAMLWDAHSVPQDESFRSASFVLVLVFMLLDTSMFVLASMFWLVNRQPPLAALLWSLAFGAAMLTAQVIGYRLLLGHELRCAMKGNRLEEKWRTLISQEIVPQQSALPGPAAVLRQPALWQPAAVALLVGGIVVAILVLWAALVTWEVINR